MKSSRYSPAGQFILANSVGGGGVVEGGTLYRGTKDTATPVLRVYLYIYNT